MRSRLTLVTTCKPFRGEAARIQRNALLSWTRLDPRPEILVCGNEEGVREVCERLGLVHVPEVERSDRGTPLLSGLLAAVEAKARRDFLALVNADIMLTSTAEPTVEQVAARFDRFLLIARRWNLDLEQDWDFAEPGWEDRLVALARRNGALEPRYGGVDLFIFPRGLWGHGGLPPFAIGRGRWDSAILYQACRRGFPIVDATGAVVTVHQNHALTNPSLDATVAKGPEASSNEALLGGPAFIFSALNASHVLDDRGLRRNRVLNPLLLLRRAATLPAAQPRLRFLLPVVRWLAPVWRRGRRLPERLRAWGRRSSLPYPSTVTALPRYPATRPQGGGTEDFDKPDAERLNRARLNHLASLGLSFAGARVLDVGAGVGHLAQFFVRNGAQVLCLEGRPENVARMKELYPSLEGRVFDVEKDDWSTLGRFDVVLCYGLLYHVENPFRVLTRLASVCDGLLLLSTVVADHEKPLVLMDEETTSSTQALRQIGCRATPSYIALALRAAGFAHVHAPKRPPDHPDFRFTWKNNLSWQRDGHPIRCVFIASRQPLRNPLLVDLLRRA